MAYALAPHVSYGNVDGLAVMLDLNADRYFLLDKVTTSLLETNCEHGTDDAQQSILRRLASRGWLVHAAAPSLGPVLAQLPAASALETSSESSIIGLTELMKYRIGAAASLRWHGLAATIAMWRRLRTDFHLEPRCSAKADAAAAVGCGYNARLVRLPLRRRCVPDSLALLRSLWGRRLDADLYFGVRREPFAAHCWLQFEHNLLIDPLDKVAEFTAVFKL
mgnify:CR=1 FL=1